MWSCEWERSVIVNLIKSICNLLLDVVQLKVLGINVIHSLNFYFNFKYRVIVTITYQINLNEVE